MPSTRIWIVDGRHFRAGADEVPAVPPAFAALLSDGERARLQRFLKPQRAREFLLGRLLLRHALVQTLACAPSEITVTERHGASPLVAIGAHAADGVALPGLSISHSRGWLACAVGERCAVGVDIEAPSPQRDLAALAGLAFSPRELAWLGRQPAYEAAFYRLWCAKEALYKLRHNSGLRDMQELPELECGGDNSGDSGVNEGDAAQAISAPDAFLRHDATADYHLCLCSAATPTRHSVEHLECDRLLNLSAA